MNYCNVDTLFDIGAATGGYATNIKELGYRKKIISFEPLKNAYEILKKNASKYDNWLVNHYALGNEDTKCILNVAGNSDSSSILNMLPEHFNNDPSSKYTRQEEIEIKKLDTVFNSFCSKENVVMLKIDVQGFEKNVLDGAKETLPYVSVIQVEMSLVPLYENQMLFFEMIQYSGSIKTVSATKPICCTKSWLLNVLFTITVFSCEAFLNFNANGISK